MGVGLICRDEEPYSFCKAYTDVKAYPVEFESGKDWARFTTKAMECRGVAVSFVKTIRVEGACIVMETCAKNEGIAGVQSLEYCHNFFSIDGMAISPDYQVELPDLPDLGQEQKISVHGLPCNWRGNGKGLTFLQNTTESAHVRVPLEGMTQGNEFHWTLRHKGAKAWVSVTEGFRPEKMEIWSVDHMVCPEVFYPLELAPGESKSWTRRWEFGKDY